MELVKLVTENIENSGKHNWFVKSSLMWADGVVGGFVWFGLIVVLFILFDVQSH